MKQLESSKETRQLSVGSTGNKISATRGAPIAVERKWRLRIKRRSVDYGFKRRDQREGFRDASKIPGSYSMRLLPMETSQIHVYQPSMS
jgi:hypothetical protein